MRIWADHDVAVLHSRRKRILHLEAGVLEMDCQALLEEGRSQILALFVPAPRHRHRRPARRARGTGSGEVTRRCERSAHRHV
ncbi:MAG: hypothetical protein JF597_15660 [Streptomyces sp.]|nr:hypothetical protein [Streptomyces sp.]